jgi:hypothetical protein
VLVTNRIRLATGIKILPLDQPERLGLTSRAAGRLRRGIIPGRAVIFRLSAWELADGAAWVTPQI